MRRTLTDRDLALIHALYGAGLLSFSQISRRFFPERTKATTHNRLTLLERRGFLSRTRVGRLIHHYENREIGVVFQPTRKAIRILQLLKPLEAFRDDPVPIATGDLFHDLMLSEVVEGLSVRFPETIFRNSKTLPKNLLPMGRVPDALVHGPMAQITLAVELEITGKSEKRYRQIITSYRVHPRIEKVLYVTASKTIEDKITGLIAHKPVPGLPAPPTSKFYFTSLKELIANPTSAAISNGKDQLTMRHESNPSTRKDIA